VVVSLLRLIIELPPLASIKEKRRIVKSLVDRVRSKYRVSIAEIDLQESLTFAEIGAAFVSNSRRLGETVMNKVLRYVEDNCEGRVNDASIMSERY
jgi:uncharacterized protein YlxP (DUF503 family)